MAQYNGDQHSRLTEAGLLLTSCMEKFEKGTLDRDGFHIAVGKYIKKLPEGPVHIPVPKPLKKNASKPLTKAQNTLPGPHESNEDKQREDSQGLKDGDDVPKRSKGKASTAGV